jgi:prephenate dehydratase
MIVAYPEASGAAGEAAAQALTPAAGPHARPSPRAVFESVASGAADRGVVPVEHSERGSEGAVLDLLREFVGSVTVAGETWVPDDASDGVGGYGRYLVITKSGTSLKGANKTMIVLTPSLQVPNSLFRALTTFVGRRLAIHRIEPRPRPGSPGRYHYVVEVEGDVSGEAVTSAIADASSFCEKVVVLGSYAAAELP